MEFQFLFNQTLGTGTNRPHSYFSCQVYKNNQSGSVDVVALSMIVLLAMFAFVIDTGFLFVREKNKYYNGVKATTMAGVVTLCDDDPEGVA